MGVTLASWLEALQALLPPGRALSREPGAVLTRLLEAIASVLLAAQLRFEALLVQFNPLRASSMLTDLERLLGLPDDCMAGTALTTEERQRIASQRLMEQGGQSRAYFIGQAEQLGEPGVTITEFRPMNCNDDCNDSLIEERGRFIWRVNVPHGAADRRTMNCNDSCESALDMYRPSLIECPITERKPGHTKVIFAYT